MTIPWWVVSGLACMGVLAIGFLVWHFTTEWLAKKGIAQRKFADRVAKVKTMEELVALIEGASFTDSDLEWENYSDPPEPTFFLMDTIASLASVQRAFRHHCWATDAIIKKGIELGLLPEEFHPVEALYPCIKA